METGRVLLKASSIGKEFRQGQRVLTVLRDLSLEIHERDALCIVGPSGAGKSTFLQILGLLDSPTSGSVFYANTNLSRASEEEKARFRRDKIGFVFQFHYLLSEFSALENVMIAGQIGGMSRKKSKAEAERLLSLLGLKDRQRHFPSELSGGEQQRAALARALMNRPKILFTDEPTGNLDVKNSIKILDILFELRETLGVALAAVSHDLQFSKRFPKVLPMRDGKWCS